jgi:hypothetical protein
MFLELYLFCPQVKVWGDAYWIGFDSESLSVTGLPVGQLPVQVWGQRGQGFFYLQDISESTFYPSSLPPLLLCLFTVLTLVNIYHFIIYALSFLV